MEEKETIKHLVKYVNQLENTLFMMTNQRLDAMKSQILAIKQLCSADSQTQIDKKACVELAKTLEMQIWQTSSTIHNLQQNTKIMKELTNAKTLGLNPILNEIT